jgi:hypothetical protein
MTEATLSELLPGLKALPHADKIRAMQFLVSELAKEEKVTLLEPDATYPIWSPYNSFGAADTLIEFLKEEHITYAE